MRKMKKESRAGLEEWAQGVLERELGHPVVIHDDGTRPGMYDLRIGPVEAPRVAVECVGAVDPVRTETWNIGPAKGPWQLNTRADWLVMLRPDASIKDLRKGIEKVLQRCEDAGLSRVYDVRRLPTNALLNELDVLGVVAASCVRSRGTGTLHFTMTGPGRGVMDSNGDETAKWIGTFLRCAERRDVVEKLKRSGAKDRHAFVFLSAAGAPWAVESYFWGGLHQLPTEPPDLPEPVKGVWIASWCSDTGVHWDGRGWRSFSAATHGRHA